MRYVKPEYYNEIMESSDVILVSAVELDGGATLTQINEGTAQVGASALDVLGLR